MIQFFENNNLKHDGELVVFALSKKGSIVPCTLMIKLVPNLRRGIQFIGFLIETDDLSSIFKSGEPLSNRSVFHSHSYS